MKNAKTQYVIYMLSLGQLKADYETKNDNFVQNI